MNKSYQAGYKKVNPSAFEDTKTEEKNNEQFKEGLEIGKQHMKYEIEELARNSSDEDLRMNLFKLLRRK